MKWIALALLLGVAQADEWTAGDTALQLAFTTVTVIDWAQTRTFTAEGLPESNPILGEHPSRARVNTLIGGAIIGHAVVARLLPKPYRTFWQIGFTYLEIAAVSNNHLAGVRIKF